jgi:putative glycerol-1-phosphate prenyltransferase
MLENKAKGKKQLALLIDPGKKSDKDLATTISLANTCNVDYIFVGGSLISEDIDSTVSFVKQNSNIPVVIFPGSIMQISKEADALLLLSLISGRNPDLLIGSHVIAAPYLKKTGVEIISTGYILVGTGETTTVEYMSNTRAIPSKKHDIVVATAMAGEMLGLKLIYLEAGSGAGQVIDHELINKTRNSIDLPIIVGGGIRTAYDMHQAFQAGADIVVIGTVIEQHTESLQLFANR